MKCSYYKYPSISQIEELNNYKKGTYNRNHRVGFNKIDNNVNTVGMIRIYWRIMSEF